MPQFISSSAWWRDKLIAEGKRDKMIDIKADALKHDGVVCDKCGYIHANNPLFAQLCDDNQIV